MTREHVGVMAARRADGRPVLELRLYRAEDRGFMPTDTALQVPLEQAPELWREIRKTARAALWAMASGADRDANSDSMS